MYALGRGPLPDGGCRVVTAHPAGSRPEATDSRELLEALTDENKLLSRRLQRERRIRREAEEIAEKGLRDLYQRQMRLEALSRLAQQLSAALTPRDIGAVLSEELLNAAGADALSLGLVNANRRDLDWVTTLGYSRAALDHLARAVLLSDRTVSTDAVRSGQPIAIGTSAEYADTYPDDVHWSGLNGAESTVGWPLVAGGEPFGVLLLVWTETQPLDTAQRAFISAAATMVSQALVRARIYSDEHARAAVLQAAVLPSTPVETPGLEVCVTYEPADASHGLGGDWYDVMPLPGNRTYLAVGDVVGHGLSAVEDMAQLRSAGRALAHHGLSPAQLLAQLNGFTRDASNGKFATVAVAIFDRDDAWLSYSTAGHPPPLFRQSSTGTVSRLSAAHGPVLGPVPGAGYTESGLAVGPGDILMLYTDGLVERHSEDIDTGIAEAERILAEWDPETGVSRNCGLLAELLSTRNRADDVCVAVVRFTGSGF
jgi:serine phosphatase RsbU (regulator of sigma subunit)